MKIILIAINAKFVHTNLALRSIREVLEENGHECILKEYAINQPVESIYLDLISNDELYDYMFFSIYIWNNDIIFKLIEMISKVSKTKIILGGPEVSYRDETDFKKMKINGVVRGYGEGAIVKYLDKVKNEEEIPFIIEGQGDRISIAELPFAYRDEELKIIKDRIIYYEGSRGCPFHCAFCLSGEDNKYEERTAEQVIGHMKKFIEADVRQVKFVDRTFNTRPNRALEIMKGILNLKPKRTNFHFEMTAERISEEMLIFLETVPKGLFQFEIGVQSSNEKTLKEVNRKNDFNILNRVLPRLIAIKGVHVHLDLIAGLPFEDLNSFKKSFNKVYSYRAEKLQLGFLKLIYGSKLRENKEKYDYQFTSFGMYEVLSSKWLSYRDMLRLKKLEDMLDRYGNENYFEKTIDYLLGYYDSSYDFFDSLANFWYKNNYQKISHQRVALYDILFKFTQNNDLLNSEIIKELLIYDYFSTQKTSVKPKFYSISDDILKIKHALFHNSKFREEFFLDIVNIPTKKLVKYFELIKLRKIDPRNNKEIKDELFILFDKRKDVDRTVYFVDKNYLNNEEE